MTEMNILKLIKMAVFEDPMTHLSPKFDRLEAVMEEARRAAEIVRRGGRNDRQ